MPSSSVAAVRVTPSRNLGRPISRYLVYRARLHCLFSADICFAASVLVYISLYKYTDVLYENIDQLRTETDKLELLFAGKSPIILAYFPYVSWRSISQYLFKIVLQHAR